MKLNPKPPTQMSVSENSGSRNPGGKDEGRPKTLMEDIGAKKFSDSHLLTQHVLDDCILHQVAAKAWEKELVSRFQKQYMVKWAQGYGENMYHLAADKKYDDSCVTPKALSSGVFSRFKDNAVIDEKLLDDSEQKYGFEPHPPHPSSSATAPKIISINADMNVQAVDVSGYSNPEGAVENQNHDGKGKLSGALSSEIFLSFFK